MRAFVVSASSMKKIASFLAAVLLCSQAAAADGEISELKESGDWFSVKVCFEDGCVFRAGTEASSWPDRMLAVDFAEDGSISVTILTDELTEENLRTWGGTSHDRVSADFRVDRKRVITTDIERELDREDGTIYETLDPEVFSTEFVGELRTGRALRIRYHLSEGAATTRFSLKGASSAIDRAAGMAGRARANADDRFFDDAPSKPSKPSKGSSEADDGAFFL